MKSACAQSRAKSLKNYIGHGIAFKRSNGCGLVGIESSGPASFSARCDVVFTEFDL